MVTKKPVNSEVTPAAEVKKTVVAAKETAPVKAAAASKAEPKKASAEAKKETKAPKKAAAKKPAAKKPAAAKKTAAKKAEVQETLVLQFAGKEIQSKDLLDRVKEIWKNEGNKEDSLVDIKVYVKPEESAAYYVITGDVTGCINL